MTDSATLERTSTAALTKAGVSIWLDDINRENLSNGKLEELIDKMNVVGVTTNPTIFAGALSKGNAYDEQVSELADNNMNVVDALFEITTRDVGHAADLLERVYRVTDGYDGRVSIEVTPGSAYDTAQTIDEAKRLWSKIDRPNVMIKIPATQEGLAAIRETIGNGISVNVTLIFGLDRYREVIDAYLGGLEDAAAKGIDLSTIHSVASFFVSRVDTEIDKRIKDRGADTQSALHNKVAVANARLAYQVFQDAFNSDRAQELLTKGCNLQRPLWASTGVKTDELPATYYVTELVAGGVVNTMPEKTLRAAFDYDGEITDTIVPNYGDAASVMQQLKAAGINIDDVTETLEREGVEKFVASWQELTDQVQKNLNHQS